MGPSQLPPLEGGVFSTYSMGSVRKSEQHCAFWSECRRQREEPWQRRPGGCQRESRGWTEGPSSLPGGPHQPCLRVQAPRPCGSAHTHQVQVPPSPPHQCRPCVVLARPSARKGAGRTGRERVLKDPRGPHWCRWHQEDPGSSQSSKLAAGASPSREDPAADSRSQSS